MHPLGYSARVTHTEAARHDIARALLVGASALLGGATVGALGAAVWYRWDRATSAPGTDAAPWGPEGPR